MIRKVPYYIQHFLARPSKVLVYCALLAFIALGIEGSLFQLWRLYRDESQLTKQIGEIRASTKDLNFQIERARDPKFIEKQARERFDLVEEDDLVFVFSE